MEGESGQICLRGYLCDACQVEYSYDAAKDFFGFFYTGRLHRIRSAPTSAVCTSWT